MRKQARWSVGGRSCAHARSALPGLLLSVAFAIVLLAVSCDGGGPTKGRWGNVHYWCEIGEGGVGGRLWCGKEKPDRPPDYQCGELENAQHVPGGIRCQKFPGPQGWVSLLCSPS